MVKVSSQKFTIKVQSLIRKLPPFSTLVSHYLKYGSDYVGGGIINEQFANIVGGKVKINIDSGSFPNTCALRVSHVLNESRHYINYISKETSSSKGKKWYIFRVAILYKYMKETYGRPDITSSNPKDFIGKKGVIMYDMGDFWTDATGHFTLWNGSKRLGGSYSHNYYITNGKKAHLWIAK